MKHIPLSVVIGLGLMGALAFVVEPNPVKGLGLCLGLWLTAFFLAKHVIFLGPKPIFMEP